MWNRKKDEEQTPRAGSQPSAAEPAREVNTMPSTPTRSYEPTPVAGGNAATIGKAVMIKGQIFSREDLYVDGEMEGTVELAEHRLTVGPNGKLKAGVKAREIIVLGVIQGNVEATDKVEIRKEARLIGDILTSRIVIEDGAFIKGNIDISRQEPVRAAKLQPPQQAAPAPPSHPPTAAGAAEKR